MSKRKAEQPLQPLPLGEQEGSAGCRRSAGLRPFAGAAEEEQQHRTAVAATVAPFQRLATVELQLIMQHCDFKTLLALARCSRFTFQAASNPFAWRALPPLFLAIDAAGLGARLRGSRLLSHCDVALRWMFFTYHRLHRAVDNAELAAIEYVPRLVELDTRSRQGVCGIQLQRLLSHPSIAGLTALHCRTDQMDGACTALLPQCQPRLRTLSLKIDRSSDADRHLLAPLALLHSLTNLSLDENTIHESAVEIIGRCASLRRLHISRVEPAVLFAVLKAPARTRLESLSLRGVFASCLSGDVHSWRVSFENLQSLRSLSLQHCSDHDEMFAGAAAALATGGALRSLTALRTGTLKMNNEGGSLIPLLAAHCPQLRRLHIYEITASCEKRDRGTLVGLPLLSSLTDLRLQRGAWQSNGDVLAVGRCAALTRLHLSDMSLSSLHSILCSPQMQRLESLTLGSVDFDSDDRDDEEDDDGAEGEDEDEDGGGDADAAAASDLDWSVCFANLVLLRALNLDECDGGDQLLAAVQAVRPPFLCSMRFSHEGGRSGTGVIPQLRLLPVLLVQLPALRVELIEEAPPPVPGCYRLVEKAGQLNDLHKAWRKLKRQHPARVTITRPVQSDPDPLGSWTD